MQNIIKSIFSVDKKHLFRDVFELVIMVVLIMFPFCTYYSLQYSVNMSSNTEEYYGTVISARKAILELNQAIAMEKALYGVSITECKNAGELARLFSRRLNSTETYNFTDYTGKNNRITRTLFEDGVFDIDAKDKPIFYAPNGVFYFVDKFEEGCSVINTIDPDQASCVLIADLNGNLEPNKDVTYIKHRIDGDRIKVIISKDKAIPSDEVKKLIDDDLR